jgi:fumarylacetoacetate (FAA) hydrolase
VKLGSLKSGGRDGTLIVVNRALTEFVAVPEIAASLQRAIDAWETAAPRLNAVSDELNAGERDDTQRL